VQRGDQVSIVMLAFETVAYGSFRMGAVACRCRCCLALRRWRFAPAHDSEAVVALADVPWTPAVGACECLPRTGRVRLRGRPGRRTFGGSGPLRSYPAVNTLADRPAVLFLAAPPAAQRR
jgi:hypothetical protein